MGPIRIEFVLRTGFVVVNAEDCPEDPIEYCFEGKKVGGTITAFSAELSSCQDTENLGIEGAEVTITNGSETCDVVTGNDGSYSCDTFCEDGPFEVCVTTVCDESCGVTTLDLLLLQRVILELEEKTRLISLIGDVNGDGKNKSNDLLTIRKEILGISTGVENWCKFVPVDDYFNYGIDVQDLDNCIIVDDPSQNVDFIRFMLGDLNGSCSDCIHGDEDDITGEGPVVVLGEAKGEIDIKIPEVSRILGFSTFMDIPKDTEILSVESDLRGLEYNVVNDQLRIIWVDLSDEGKGYDNSRSSSLVKINYSGKQPILSKNHNLVNTLEKGILNLVQQTKVRSSKEDYRVLNIRNIGSVNFFGESNDVNIELYDISGKLIKRSSLVLDRSNNVDIDHSTNLGIYFLRLFNESNDITQKVLLSDRD